MATTVTHNTLPEAVARLEARIEDVYKLLTTKVIIKSELPKYLNINQAVEYCNSNGYKISKSSMYKLCARSEIPHFKASGSLVFDACELDNFIINQLNINRNGKQYF